MSALDWQGWLTIGIVLATLALLLWERFTPDKVLLGAVAVLIATGILGPVEALSGFWNRGVLTVAVLFVLVAALKSTGAIRWIGDWVLGRPKGEWRAQARDPPQFPHRVGGADEDQPVAAAQDFGGRHR